VRLRELKCPLCKGRDLEELGEDRYKCRFCGLIFRVYFEEEDGMVIEADISTASIDYNLVVGRGEGRLIECPHCGREIYMWFKTLESDPDWIDIVVVKGDSEVLEKVEIPPEGEE